jgi:hypothetical protein
VSSTGSSVAGVLSLNGQSGTLNITSPDSSITAAGSAGTVALSTTGNALAPSTVSATGVISSATNINATGSMSAGTTITATGAISGASVASSGAITGASLALSGSMTSLYLSNFVSSIPTVAIGAVQPLDALNTYINTTRNANRSTHVLLNLSGDTNFANGIPFCQAFIAFPPRNSADNINTISQQQDGMIYTVTNAGATGAKVYTIQVQNGSSVAQTYNYSFTVLGS